MVVSFLWKNPRLRALAKKFLPWKINNYLTCLEDFLVDILMSGSLPIDPPLLTYKILPNHKGIDFIRYKRISFIIAVLRLFGKMKKRGYDIQSLNTFNNAEELRKMEVEPNNF